MTPECISQAQLEKILKFKPTHEEEIPATTFDFQLVRALLASGKSEFTDLFTRRTCQPGEILFRENELGEMIGIIWSGQVAILKGSLDDPVILSFRSSGDVVGEMALLESRPRSASVISVEETEILVTDQQGFQALLSKPPFVGLNLLENLSARLREADTMRSEGALVQRQLASQVSALETEKAHLLELQRLRQETTDLIVHDLRNPLGSIIFAIKSIEVLLDPEGVAQIRDLLDIAVSSSSRMQRLVDSLLEVSRMEAGESELVRTKVDLGSLAERTMQNVGLVHQHTLNLETHIPFGLPAVSVDADKIERVLANLLDNATKHTPGGGKVTLAIARQDHTLVVSVNDSGPGIPLEERQRIFERFSQVPGEKKRRRGFGLGLTYCKLTVEAHGGKIWVEGGESGVGSKFIFTLPLES